MANRVGQNKWGISFQQAILLIFLFIGLTPATVTAQRADFWVADSVYNARRAKFVGVGIGGGYAAAYTTLSVAWYGSGLQGPFRWFDDSHEWLQLDKLGHAYGAYLECKSVNELLRWSGVKRTKRLFWAGISGFVMQSPIEILDGYSPTYGASWSDIVANASGSVLWAVNEGVFREQIITMKWSFWPSGLAAQRPDLLGDNIATQALKDYNGQTYWLGITINKLLPQNSRTEHLYPNWLGIAIGYGGHGMLGGYGTEPQSKIQTREIRQYYVGLDIDFQQIHTQKQGLKILFWLLNCVRIPLPTFRLDEKGTTRFYPFFFSE